MSFSNVYPYSSVYPGKFGVIPAEWGVAVAADTPSANDTSGEDRGVRNVIDSDSILKSGTIIRVSFRSATTEALTIDAAYIGHQALSGDVWDFDGNQVELLFSGGSGFAISSSSSITSDDITFALDASKNLIIAFGVNSTTGQGGLRFSSGDTDISYHDKSGGNGEEGTTDVSGYSSGSTGRLIGLIQAYG